MLQLFSGVICHSRVGVQGETPLQARAPGLVAIDSQLRRRADPSRRTSSLFVTTPCAECHIRRGLRRVGALLGVRLRFEDDHPRINRPAAR